MVSPFDRFDCNVAVAYTGLLSRTPLPFSYSAEILPYHMRLKGLGILLSVQNVAQAFVGGPGSKYSLG